MPPDLSVWVTERIAAFPEECAEGLQWLAPEVAEYAALPLYVGWWEVCALRADGELISWSIEDEYSGYSGARPIAGRYPQLSTLVLGCQRYESVRILLPPRPSDAEDCTHLGHPAFADGKLICPQCCDLGWVRPCDRLAVSVSRLNPRLPWYHRLVGWWRCRGGARGG